jgi:hypothetical protein
MSMRVLRVPSGQRYNHHFLDDLESFFWLILWSVVTHLDPGAGRPTQSALNMLNSLDISYENADAAHTKRSLLDTCSRLGGHEMLDELALFQNTWASDPMVTSVIIRLGSYFHGIDPRRIASYAPLDVFPFITKIFLDALDGSSAEGQEGHYAMQTS